MPWAIMPATDSRVSSVSAPAGRARTRPGHRQACRRRAADMRRTWPCPRWWGARIAGWDPAGTSLVTYATRSRATAAIRVLSAATCKLASPSGCSMPALAQSRRARVPLRVSRCAPARRRGAAPLPPRRAATRRGRRPRGARTRSGSPPQGCITRAPRLHLLHPPALADVAVDGVGCDLLLAAPDRRAQNGNVQGRAVLAPAHALCVALPPAAHHLVGEPQGVFHPVGGYDQVVQEGPDTLGRRVAEHAHEVAVRARDPVLHVEQHDGLGGALEQLVEQRGLHAQGRRSLLLLGFGLPAACVRALARDTQGKVVGRLHQHGASASSKVSGSAA